MSDSGRLPQAHRHHAALSFWTRTISSVGLQTRPRQTTLRLGNNPAQTLGPFHLCILDTAFLCSASWILEEHQLNIKDSLGERPTDSSDDVCQRRGNGPVALSFDR